MRTNVQHIFAIGDIVGQPMLAHKAMHEAYVAAECQGWAVNQIGPDWGTDRGLDQNGRRLQNPDHFVTRFEVQMDIKLVVTVMLIALSASSSYAQKKSALDVCWDQGAAASEKNRADMKTAVSAKKASTDDEASFKASQDNIAKIHAANKAAGYTLQKCQDLGKLIADETTFVAKVTAKAAPPAPAPEKPVGFAATIKALGTAAAAAAADKPPSGAPKCADEGGTCSFPASEMGQEFVVDFGTGDKWTTMKLYPNPKQKTVSIDCKVKAFPRDPAVQVKKTCYGMATGLVVTN
jgi:hypothetical protein